MNILTEGLKLYTQNESLDTAHSNAGDARLLVRSDGLEFVRGRLEKGHRFHLYPPEELSTTEIYFILRGSLAYQAEQMRYHLGPGDYIVAQGLQEATVFTSLSDVEFLYITSQPSFDEISVSLNTLKQLTQQIADKDAGETIEHCRRMRELSYAVGKRLGLSPQRMLILDHAAYFHDVGKLEVPPEILKKPGPLTAAEWTVMQRHPISGRLRLENAAMKEVGIIVEQHHERLDGSGYPYGLRDSAIRTEASIVAVADSYDAMTSNRPYRGALTREEALSELERCAGLHYPGEVVAALRKEVERSG